MDDEETAGMWLLESGKHMLTGAFTTSGLFGLAGYLIWTHNATCTPDTVVDVACTKQLDFLGLITFTSAGHIGGLLAVVTFVVSGVILFVISERRSAAERPPE